MASTTDLTCVPMNCRGMELLGFSWKATVCFCVHQVAIELWRLYDTPRVSIQKKIQDLHIRLEACTKPQIRLLRENGIIDNFRATMIMLEDAERLFDALEHSRKKRGLAKHALKAKCGNAAQRALRTEEQRSMKLGQRVRPNTTRLVCEEPRRINQRYGGDISECALNRTAKVEEDEEDTPIRPSKVKWRWDTLVFASDVEQVRDVCNEYEHQIEVISNTVQVAGEASDIQNSCVKILRMEQHKFKPEDLGPLNFVVKNPEKRLSPGIVPPPEVFSPSPPEPLKSPGFSDTLSLKSHPSIRSPTFESGEFDEQTSCYSMGKNSSPEDSSDRFLLFDSVSDSEESGTDSDVFIVDAPHPLHPPLPPSTISSPEPITSPPGGQGPLQIKRVIATKLRHFAKNTSPHSHKRLHSLIVSVSLSDIKPFVTGLKQRVVSKPTALSSFAMKKRACSSTPSFSSDTSVVSESGSEYELPVSQRDTSISRNLQVQSSQSQHCISLRSRGKTIPTVRISSPQPVTTRSSTLRSHVTSMEVAPASSNVTTSQPSSETTVSGDLKRRLNGNPLLPSAPAPRLPATARGVQRNGIDGSAPPPHPTAMDDDQVSLSSFTSSSNLSSNSTNASSYCNAPSSFSLHNPPTNGIHKRKYRKKSQIINLPANRLKSTISFEELFNFHPPKLVVSNGELVPEKSLSIKRLERQEVSLLPQAHPFLKWTLGQPVKTKTLRKRKV